MKKEIKFDFCVGVEELIEFVETNSHLEWNDICDMEYKYRKQVYANTENKFMELMILKMKKRIQWLT